MIESWCQKHGVRSTVDGSCDICSEPKIQGRELGRALAEILGIPTQNLIRLELIFTPDNAAVASCEFLVAVNTEKGAQLRELFRSYKIQKKEDEV